MIVNEPLGLASLDEGPWGCPYHGTVKDGELTLPSGTKIDYPQPTGAIPDVTTVPQEAGRVCRISPAWAPGDAGISPERQADDQAAGRQWQTKAVLAGSKSALHGRELGDNCWIWAEAQHRVWLVDPRELSALNPQQAAGASIDLHLTRFGWLGNSPEFEPDDPTKPWESERTITLKLPDDLGQNSPYPHLGKYLYEPDQIWVPYQGRLGILKPDQTTDDTTYFRLQDTRQSDGAQALFAAVCPDAQAKATRYHIAGVYQVDLMAQTFTILATRSDLIIKDQFDETPSDQIGDLQLNINVQLVTVGNSGGADCSDSTETAEYQISPNQYNTGWHAQGSNNYQFTSVYRALLGCGFDGNDNPQLVWARASQSYSTTASATLTFSGQNITTVHRTLDGSGNCTVTGEDHNWTATADTSLTHSEHVSTKMEILSGTKVLSVVSSSHSLDQQYTAHTAPDGTHTATSVCDWSATDFDGVSRSYSSNLQNDSAKGDFPGISPDKSWDPLLGYTDTWVLGGSDLAFGQAVYADPFCAGPNQFAIRLVTITEECTQPDTDHFICPRQALYTQFLSAAGRLDIQNVVQDETLESKYYAPYHLKTMHADVVYVSGFSDASAVAESNPVSVV